MEMTKYEIKTSGNYFGLCEESQGPSIKVQNLQMLHQNIQLHNFIFVRCHVTNITAHINYFLVITSVIFRNFYLLIFTFYLINQIFFSPQLLDLFLILIFHLIIRTFFFLMILNLHWSFLSFSHSNGPAHKATPLFSCSLVCCNHEAEKTEETTENKVIKIQNNVVGM